MNATTDDHARLRRRTLALLAAALLLSMSPWFSATAVIAQLRGAYGFGDTYGAWLTISVQLGFVLGAVASSALGIADRYSPRDVMVCGAIAASAINALLLTAESPLAWLVVRASTGMCLACVYPPALKLIATWFADGRSLALGVLVGAVTVGSALPHLLNAAGGAHWSQVIVATSATTALGSLVVALGVREGPYPFSRGRFRAGDTLRALRSRGVLLATAGYFGHMWELYAMWAWFATYARHALAMQQITLDPSLAAFGVIGVGAVGCVAAGALADRWGSAQTAAVAMAVSAACCVLAPLAYPGPAWLFLLVAALWGLSVVADSAQFSTIVTESCEAHLVGTALTLQLGLGFMLTAATIWLLPLLATTLGDWRWTVLALAPGPLLGILAMAALWRWPGPSADRPAQRAHGFSPWRPLRALRDAAGERGDP